MRDNRAKDSGALHDFYMLLPGWCTDRAGLKWHWMNDRARCRNFVITKLSCIPYLNVRHHTVEKVVKG